MFSKTLICSALLAATTFSFADAIKPFEINMDRVQVVKKGKFGDSSTYIIPTLYLHMEARNKTEAKNEGASAKARVFVEGLDKTLLQDLAKKVYEDLITKMRAAGYTVLGYDDLKTELAAFDKMKPNAKYGLPTRLFDKTLGIDFLIASPSDDQAFDYGITGPVRPYKDFAKDKKAVVIVPEIYFTAPQVAGLKGGSISMNEAKVMIEPSMKLYKANIAGLPPDLGWCSINVQEHGKRLAADVAGELKKLDEDKSTYADWSRTVADFAFVLDPQAVSSGVLRVGYALNDLTVATVKKAH